MAISIIAALVQTAWLVVEWRGGFITVEKPWYRSRPDPVERDRDRHSSTIWDAAQGLELLGLVLGFLGLTRIETHGQLVGLVGLALLFVGIAIRWAAIRTLGKVFTGVVMIQRDHELVRHGLYRHVRHPSYAGAITAHLGLGLAFASWVSIALSTLPFFVAAAYRIRVEEQALREALGDEYVAYAAGTWRLIPFVY